MTKEPSYKERTACRLCGGPIQKVMELAPTPPANEFVRKEDLGKPQELFPLYISMCNLCKHVQLPVVVPPERLFSNYLYVSSTSAVFVEHFKKYAQHAIQKLNLKPGSFILEIGSNDGCLLKFFKQEKMRVLGVDPAKNISDVASASGIQTLSEFFSVNLASQIKKDFGMPDLIIANNVFAHIDNMQGIVDGIKLLTSVKTAFVFEVSYLADVVEKLLFDTIYHEHLDYHSVGPLIKFFAKNGMSLFDVERIPSHGGSIRGYATSAFSSKFQPRQDILDEFMEHEDRLMLTSHSTFEVYLKRIKHLGHTLHNRLADISRTKKNRIVGFGAPAKATTLMHQFDLDRSHLEYIIDDAPMKQGMFTPGKQVPVVSSDVLYSDTPDHVIILAWNFADSIMKKHSRFKDLSGNWLVPLPEFKEY